MKKVQRLLALLMALATVFSLTMGAYAIEVEEALEATDAAAAEDTAETTETVDSEDAVEASSAEAEEPAASEGVPAEEPSDRESVTEPEIPVVETVESEEVAVTSTSSIKTLTLGKASTASIPTSGDVAFKFTISSTGYITLTVSHSNYRSGIVKFDIAKSATGMDGNLASGIFTNCMSLSSPETFTSDRLGLTAGTYYVHVSLSGASSSTSISVKVNFTAATCETEPNSSIGNADTITLGNTYIGSLGSYVNSTTYFIEDDDYFKFKLNEKSTVYLIFRANINLSAEVLNSSQSVLWSGNIGKDYAGTTSIGGSQAIKLGTFSAGTYYFYISGYVNDGTASSNYTLKLTTGSTSTLSTPKLTKIENTAKGVKITWNAVSGASSYDVYRKPYGGSWSKIKNVTGTSYTNTGVTSGRSYTYAIKARNSSGTTSAYYSNQLTIRYLSAPTVTKTTNRHAGIHLEWKATAGASGYNIYRRTGSGSYSRIAVVTGSNSTSYTDTSVQAKGGTTYTYRVVAYSGSYKSIYRVSDTIIRLDTPSFTSISSTSSGVVLRWSKVSGCSGYNIYRKQGSGNYVKLGYVKGKTSYTDTSAKRGVTYTYKIEAFRGDSKSASNTKTYTRQS